MNILTPILTGSSSKPPRKAEPPQRRKSIFSLFDQQLSIHDQQIEEQEQGLDDLRKEIEKYGDLLEKEPTLPNFSLFREALGRLAKKINSEAYRLEKFGGTPQNPRYYEIITVINREADRLYELIIREQKNHVAITAKVIGIKGLVVDLLT